MFTTGLMQLHESGKVTNRKGQFDGVSVATFAGGTEELYDWLDGNQDVAFLPVEVVNSPELIGRNRLMTTINGAIVDRHPGPGRRRHDRRRPVLGHRRPRGLRRRARRSTLEDRSLLCLPVDGRRSAARCDLADRALVRRRGR